MKSIPIPTPGDVISGKYRLDEVLGRGGFGVVFKATHIEMNRPVALKTLLPGPAASPNAVERFKREAVLASSMKHPNSVTLFDYGQTEEGVLYIVMELLHGRTLKHELATLGAIEPQRVERICVQVLQSLECAHERGIVHLDLKPENIFLCEIPGAEDFVKVLDFGTARMVAGADEQKEDLSSSQSFGTPKYMAPEQISALPVGPATDLYALGLIVYEMLTGSAVFQGRTPLEIVAKQLHQEIPPLPESLQQLPLARLFTATAIKDTHSRLSSASQGLAILNGALIPAPIAPVARAPQASKGVAPFAAPQQFDGGGFQIMSGGSSLLEDEWPSLPGDVTLLDPTSLMPAPKFDVDPFASEVTRHLSPSTAQGLPPEDSTVQFMVEASLDAGSDEEMEAAPTRIVDEFEAVPTQAFYTLKENDLMELAEFETVQAMEVAPTRVVGGSGASPLELLTRPAPTQGPQAAKGRHTNPRSPESAQPSSKVQDAEKTDPNKNNNAEPSDPAPVERPAVLFSVGAEAGYLGKSHSVPGVHSPSDVDIAARERAQRVGRRIGEPNRTAQVPVVSVRTVQGAPAPEPPPRQGVDRGLIAALAILGLGMIAVLTVLIAVLLLPIIRERTTQAPPVAAAPQQPIQVTPLPSEQSGAVAANTAVEPTPEAPARPVVTITSNPPGAQVLVGGKPVGVTPVDLPQTLAEGELTLDLKLDKHKDQATTVAFKGADKAIHIDMIPVAVEKIDPAAVAARTDIPVKEETPKVPQESVKQAPKDTVKVVKEAPKVAKEAPKVSSKESPKIVGKTPDPKVKTTAANNTKKTTVKEQPKGDKKKPNPFGKW